MNNNAELAPIYSDMIMCFRPLYKDQPCDRAIQVLPAGTTQSTLC
jgi:hypothetical protein